MNNSWDHKIDPYRLIRTNIFIDGGTTEIIGFSSPAGTNMTKLMVRIKYSCGGTTTRDYLSVLHQVHPELAKNIERRLNYANIY